MLHKVHSFHRHFNRYYLNLRYDNGVNVLYESVYDLCDLARNVCHGVELCGEVDGLVHGGVDVVLVLLALEGHGCHACVSNDQGTSLNSVAVHVYHGMALSHEYVLEVVHVYRGAHVHVCHALVLHDEDEFYVYHDREFSDDVFNDGLELPHYLHKSRKSHLVLQTNRFLHRMNQNYQRAKLILP